MNWVITIYNNLTYSLAMVIILSTLIQGSKRRYIAAFTVITATGLLLTYVALPNWIMPANAVLLSLCFVQSPKQHRRTFYKCLTVITLVWCTIATLSSLTMLIVPNWLYADSYNIFMGGAVLAAACAVKARPNAMNWCRQIEHEMCAIALAFVVLVFFSLVLPMYYPAISAEDARQWGVFVLSFMCVLVMVALLINRLKDLENRRKRIELQIEQQQIYVKQVNAQFGRMITLEHYYTRLFQSLSPYIRDDDMAGLRLYFEKHILPIHKEHIQKNRQLSNIQNDLIRNLVDSTIGQAAAVDSITLDVYISEKVSLPDEMALDVFEIMSNLIDNAMRELTSQQHGLLRIWLYQTDGELSVYIANTADHNIDIEQIYSRENNGGDRHGHGLKRVREIVYNQSRMEHLTYKGGMFEGKEILVQYIRITERG